MLGFGHFVGTVFRGGDSRLVEVGRVKVEQGARAVVLADHVERVLVEDEDTLETGVDLG